MYPHEEFDRYPGGMDKRVTTAERNGEAYSASTAPLPRRRRRLLSEGRSLKPITRSRPAYLDWPQRRFTWPTYKAGLSAAHIDAAPD